MIITLDGPAGAGKSTVAKLLAERLTGKLGKTFEYLDTGSMYRAVTLLGIRHHIDWEVPEELERLAESADINILNGRTFLNGEDATESARLPMVTEKTQFAADNPVVRHIMVERQRSIAKRYLAEGKGLVTEGRDQGTMVFPDASCKFFLTASPEERTKRRLGEWEQRGITGDFDEIFRQITERDCRDASRTVGPLCKPLNAHQIVSDGLTIEEVVNQLTEIFCQNCGAALKE